MPKAIHSLTQLKRQEESRLAVTGPGPDLSVWRPWAGSLLEAPTHPQML